MRVTVIVPEVLLNAANHTHIVLGKASEPNSYTAANWTDGTNLFAVSSGIWTEAQIAGVMNPDVLQGIEVPENVDLTLVQQAQAAFTLVEIDEDRDPPALTGIVAVPGDNPQAVLAWAGLTRIPEEVE